MILFCASPVFAAGRTLTIRAEDGRSIGATLFEAPRQPAPAVVLVGMLGRSRDDWQAVGQRLADANITALAIDLPGQVLPDDSKVLAAWSVDVRAAVTYLSTLPAVRPGAIGVLGASLGANLAGTAAAGDARVHSLALVSPSLDFRGVRLEAPLRTYGSRPALLAASSQDPYAARSCRELADKAPGPRELHFSETPAHGTLLLAQDAELVQEIVDWFQRTLF